MANARQYDTGKHCVFYHRYHIVCSTKYRYKVLTGRLRLRVRDICRQVCRENEVDILRGVARRLFQQYQLFAANRRAGHEWRLAVQIMMLHVRSVHES